MDEATGFTCSLEADQTTMPTYLWANLSCSHYTSVCQSCYSIQCWINSLTPHHLLPSYLPVIKPNKVPKGLDTYPPMDLVMGTKPLLIQIWKTQCIKNPLFATTPTCSALIMLRFSLCWIRQQLDKWAVAEPTCLLSFNQDASLRVCEWLKNQQQESGY